MRPHWGYLFALCLLSFDGFASTELASLRWQQRILLVSLPDDKAMSQWSTALEYHAVALNERRLWVWLRGPDDKARFPDTAEQQRLTVNWQDYPGESVVLIGLDGGIKARYRSQAFDFDQLFNVIDQMPLRRQELSGP